MNWIYNIGFSFFFFVPATLLAFCLLNKMMSRRLVLMLIFSAFFHIACTVFYSFQYFDSFSQFYSLANNQFHGFGTQFCEFIVYYIRKGITGDNYFLVLSVFSAFAFLGSVIYLKIYLLLKIKYVDKDYRMSSFWGEAVFLFWPSFAFWTVGIGKDSMCYFFIAIITYSVINIKSNRRLMAPLLIAGIIGVSMFRPYFALIFAFAILLWQLRMFIKKPKLAVFILPIYLVIFFTVGVRVLHNNGIESLSYQTISSKIQYEQNSQSKGSAFNVHGLSKEEVLFELPLIFLANLFFPLFFNARNIFAFAASVENSVFLYLFIRLLVQRKIFFALICENNELRFLGWLAFSGMLCISAFNSNFGLAMRQKTMYTPIIFLLIFVVLGIVRSARKRLKIQKSLMENIPGYQDREAAELWWVIACLLEQKHLPLETIRVLNYRINDFMCPRIGET